MDSKSISRLLVLCLAGIILAQSPGLLAFEVGDEDQISRRRMKFRQEILAPFVGLFEGSRQGEIKADTRLRIGFGATSFVLRDLFHMHPSEKTIRKRQIQSIDLMVRLRDQTFNEIIGVDLLKRISDPRRPINERVQWRARHALIEIMPTLEKLERDRPLDILLDHRESLAEVNELADGSLGDIGKTMIRRMDQLILKGLKTYYTMEDSDSYSEKRCVSLHYFEAGKGFLNTPEQLVCAPLETILENPFLAPTRLATGVLTSLVHAIIDTPSNVAGIITAGSYGKHGRELGSSLGNQAVWVVALNYAAARGREIRAIRESTQKRLAQRQARGKENPSLIQAVLDLELSKARLRDATRRLEAAEAEGYAVDMLGRFIENGKIRTILDQKPGEAPLVVQFLTEKGQTPMKGLNAYPFAFGIRVALPEISLFRIKVPDLPEGLGPKGLVSEWFTLGQPFGKTLAILESGKVPLEIAQVAKRLTQYKFDRGAKKIQVEFELTTDANLFDQGAKPRIDFTGGPYFEWTKAAEGLLPETARFAYEHIQTFSEIRGISRGEFLLEHQGKNIAGENIVRVHEAKWTDKALPDWDLNQMMRDIEQGRFRPDEGSE